MTSHLRYDFPVESFGENQLGAGARWEETIHEANDEGDERGEKVGTVTLTNEDKDPTKRFTAAFAFDVGGTATYEGKIPGDGSWKGKEKIKLKKKDGRPRKEEIEVDSRNPKRWG